MSTKIFTAGTTLAAPAIGGGSYITYQELTKEEETKTSTSDGEADRTQATEGKNNVKSEASKGSLDATRDTVRNENPPSPPASTQPNQVNT